ncbi:MAG TPA: hypothetical protein VIW46_00740 [Acidimicrobiia bacterium]
MEKRVALGVSVTALVLGITVAASARSNGIRAELMPMNLDRSTEMPVTMMDADHMSAMMTMMDADTTAMMGAIDGTDPDGGSESPTGPDHAGHHLP